MYNELNVFDQGNSSLAPQNSPLDQSLFPSPEKLGGLLSENIEIPAPTPTTLVPNFPIHTNLSGLHSLVDPLVETSPAVNLVNEIVGTGGRDVLTGTPLSDRIIGGFGADIITGGLGSDIFVYQSIRDAGDTITDFELRIDAFDFSTVLSSVGYQGLNPIADGYIKFNTYANGTVILLDTDGHGSLSPRPYIYVENVTPEELSSYPNHFIPNPGEPPQIQARLINDTGISESDRLTFDPSINGTINFTSDLVSFQAGLNAQPITADILDSLQSDGTFVLTAAQLAQINGGTLNDGAYTLKLQAADSKGNLSSVYTIEFVLDTTPPIFNLQLDPDFDSPPIGDLQTTFPIVNLVGTTEPNITVTLQTTGLSTTANELGQFTFSDVSLELGSNLFTVVATDLAGNQGEFSQTFQLLPQQVNQPPTALNLSNNIIAENVPDNNLIGTFTTDDRDTADIHTYTLVNGEGDTDNTAFTIVDNELRIIDSPDFETQSVYSIRVKTTDVGGLFFEQIFTINIADINEAPTDILLDGDSVEENVVGAVVGTISVIDPDTIPAFLNNTVTVNDNRFEVVIDNGTLLLKLKDERSLDHGVETTVNLTLTATDASDSSLTYSKNFIINVNENIPPPDINATLANDTGVSNSDRLTFNPTVIGQTQGATALLGNLNGNGFVDISNALNEDGSFTIFLAEYEILGNGALPDGEYSLELKAINSTGQESDIAIVNFILDLTPPPVDFALAPESDTGVLGDGITTERFVTLLGQTEPELTVVLLETEQITTSDSQGNFSFSDVTMPVAGQAPFTVIAVDLAGNQGRSLQFFTREGINGAPEIISTPETIFDTANQTTYTYEIIAIDPDNDPLTYTLLNIVQGTEIDENGILRFTPSGILQPSYNFSVEVSDRRGRTDTQTFTVEIPNFIENRPPEFTSSPIIEGKIGTEYSYQPTAIDPDGDSLIFSLIAAPDGLTIEVETGLLLWNPINEQLGDNTVIIQVSDAGGLKDTQSFTITVQDRLINNAPIFVSDPITDFAIAVPNTATGNVNPELISLSLANGETTTIPISLRLPSGGISTGGQADIVFVVDESGSMAEEHDWLTDMVLELDAALQTRGITDNRYSLIGYTNQTRIFNLADQTQVSVYGPSNQLVASGSFGAFISNPQLKFNLSADGTYTVVINPTGTSVLPIEYNLNAVLTDPTEIALTNFNTPFFGTVAPQAQETLTFDAPAGTQIFFDGLNSSAVNDIRARLVGPNGNNIFNNVRLSDDNGPHLLSTEGTYSLIVTGGNAGGNFGFQLLEFNSAATEIVLNTEITGTISSGLVTEVFQFNATAGQRLYFDSAANQSITAAIYSPDNRLLGSNTSLRDFTATVPSTGTYTLILRSTSNNPVNYNFRLVTPETQQATLAIGDIVTGNLGEAGEEDIYFLEGTAGQRIWFDGLSADSTSMVAQLVSPTGVQIFGNTRSDRNSNQLILPESGIYSLVISGADQIGNYSFQVLDFITNATDITSEVATSTEINVTFDVALQTQLYTFAGTAGQQLVFDSISGSVAGNWQLHAPDNTRLAQASISNNLTVALPTDGIYTLLLERNSSGSFTFKVSEQIIEETTITLGNTISGTVGSTEEKDIYRFSGNAGQRIRFDGLASDSFNISVRLASPTGQTLFNSIRADRDSGIVTLPETGTYHIIVNGNNVSGNYSFRLLDIADANSLTLGVDVNSTITPGLATELYTFEGMAGQKLLFDMIAVSNSFGGNWSLYGPTANEFIARNTRLDDFTAVLPTDGTYTLLIEGSSNNPISYTFNVTDISTPTSIITPSGFGSIRTGTLTASNQEDIFTFDAPAGTRIVFDGLTASSNNLRARLVAPDGSLLLSNQQLTNDFARLLILPESGTYSVAVTTIGALGDYSFRILNIDDATPLPLDTVFNGSLSIGRGRDIYKFTGTAGQQLFFDGISATGGSGSWRLYSPEHIQLGESSITNNFTATLPADGTYIVMFDGTSANAFNFSVQVVNVEIPESTLTIGETISGSLTKVGQQDIYRFNANAGQRILFDGLGSTTLNANARLVSPTGVQVLGNTRSDRNSNPLILTESGEYSLIITAGERTDNYSFRLLDLDTATTTIDLNNLVNGTISGLATDVYQFIGNAGQELFFNALTGTNSVSWTLLGSGNADLGNRSFPQDFSAVLPGDGTYTLLLNSNSANPVNFSLEIVTHQRATVAINYGEVITGDLSQPGETDIYQFTGVAGQQIWFDGLESTASAIEVALVSPSGTRIFDRLRVDRDNATPFTLFESGTYSLVINSGVRNPGDITGDYSFQVLEIIPNLTVPNDLTGKIVLPSESQVFQFAGMSGQKLIIKPNEGIFGTAAQLSNATNSLSISQGGTEDGYLGINAALQLPFREDAIANIILVTDEDRAIVNNSLNLENILAQLINKDILLDAVVNAIFIDELGNNPLGVDANRLSYIPDGSGGFITTNGGKFSFAPPVFLGSNFDVKEDYIDLVWANDGVAWDLNQLREGGDNAVSFTQAFVNRKAQDINEQLAITLLVTDPNLNVENLTGPIFGVNPGSTVNFDTQITGDGLARSFEIFFVRPETGFVLGSIPVSINQNYFYLAQAIDPDGDPITYSLVNAPTGATINATTGRIDWTPPTTGLYQFEVAVTDDRRAQTIQSYQVQVVAAGGENTAPIITSTAPETIRIGQNLTYQVTATDAENDPLTFFLAEAPEGVSVALDTGLLTWNPTKDQIGEQTITVKVVDSRGGSDTQSFVIAVNENQKPIFSSNPVRLGNPNQLYEYDVNAIDPEGTTITYSLRPGSPDGITIDPETGLIQWLPTTEQVGQFPITVFATDAEGERSQQSFFLNIGTPGAIDDGGTGDGGNGNGGTDTALPQVNLGFNSNVINLGDTLSLQIQGFDSTGLANLDLSVNGTSLTLNLENIQPGEIYTASFTPDRAGLFEVIATATDVVGNTTTKTNIIRVVDPNDQEAPTVELDLSGFDPLNSVITNLTNIVGTINDPNLEFYRVELAPINLINLRNLAANDPDYITIAQGKGDISDGVLAQIDPSLYRNDTYYLRVYAQDYSGNINVQGVILGINTQTKPGEFSLGFTDLSVPLTGIPIEITRNYSSLDTGFLGDFGYGWNLGMQDAQIVEASPDGRDLTLDNFFGGNSFTVGTRVSLTTPDGRRVGFTFEPVVDFVGFFFGARYAPYFRPDPGVYETLEVPDFPLSVRSDGSVGLYIFSGFTYNPSEYILTTKDGTKYTYDQYQGLQTIKDRNDNTLTYTDAGIFSSTGQSITFERDTQGRITEIIDPDGNSLIYTYDVQGNLTGFTDRTNNETTFKYEGDRPHYLTEIIDPLNRNAVRTEYDNRGQISRIFDADGNAIDINYDSAASRQTIKDPFGNSTTFVFDARGNVVSEIDALNGVTTRTYDNNNNLLTVTDPEGNTNTYTYDSRGNILTETDGEGNTKRYTYNARNDILTETDALGNITTYTYDANGNLTSRRDALSNFTTYKYGLYGLLTEVVDANSQTSTFGYDVYGNLTELVDPTGAKFQFTYDRNGRVTSVIDALGAITNYIYDAQGRLIEQTDPEGNACGCGTRGITRTEYNAAGEKIAEIDALGRRTEYRYNERGLLVAIIYPDATPDDLSDNPKIQNEYDALDRLITSVDELGRKTHYIYDALGRQIEIIYPDSTPEDLSDNPRIKTEYDKAGRMIAEIDELGNRTEYRYDQADRLINLTNALNEFTTYAYDASGRMISMTDELGRRTNYAYDGLDRLISTTYANSAVMTMTYDSLGRVIAQTDLAGNTTSYEYDPLGQLTAVVDALDQRTEYKYDAVGNLVEQKDANGNITRFEYDSLRRRTAMILPLGQRSEMNYDKVGNLVIMTDFNGVDSTFGYDERDRLITKSFSDGTPTETFTYTLTGELATVSDNRGVTSFGYDERDRLLFRTEPDGRTISYTYDLAGNILTLAVPSGTTRYTYDPLNRINTVIDPDSGITRYTYDAVSNLIKTEFPNRITENQQYDLLNRPTYVENRNSTDILSSYTYTLDAMGNRIKVEEHNGRIVEYNYDDLYRLTQEKITDIVAGNKTVEYKFDSVGNRLQRIDSVEGTTTYTYDANDRLLEEILGGKVTQYQYDARGNLTAKVENGETLAEYEWNAKGELVAVEVTENGATGRTEFEYDYQGIRVAINIDGEETRFLIDTNQQQYAQVIEEYQANGTVNTSYVHGWDLISQADADGRIYYQMDGLGSTRLLTDNDGAILAEYDYDAYGNLTRKEGDADNNYLFAGEQFDESVDGYYLRARYYDPATGRFVSTDPFQGYLDQSVTLHDYLYTGNNPVNFVDPSGFIAAIEYSALNKRAPLLASAIRCLGGQVLTNVAETGVYIILTEVLPYVGQSKTVNKRSQRSVNRIAKKAGEVVELVRVEFPKAVSKRDREIVEQAIILFYRGLGQDTLNQVNPVGGRPEDFKKAVKMIDNVFDKIRRGIC